jgi:hypothetical protein
MSHGGRDFEAIKSNEYFKASEFTLRGPDFKNLDKWVWVPGYEAGPRNEKRPHTLLFCDDLPGYAISGVIFFQT